ncbi:unnamed protein product [Rotaria magnacalcarata]|uniref:Transposase n=3 Tax=Rotaria magnacalcarata TaxID=392030 RepID=A0A815DSL6_9BILA|nr:unnamed protein product [Rotaria magnacalcarata]CAF1297570.1 unnamed protein product [Rotaria magnacalcarata]
MGRKAVDTAIKRSILVLRDSGMSQHEISRKLKISRHCVQQTIRKFNEFHTVATKSGAGRHSKLTNRQKRAIKLQKVRDDTLPLTDLVQYVQTSLNITISRRTVSRILHEFGMVSYIAPRKLRINYGHRCARLLWCYQHLTWTEKDWSNVIFTDESNFEILNRKNRIYIRRFRNDLKRFERSQQRVHTSVGVGIGSYLTCHGLGPLVFYDGSLNSDKYIDILDKYLPTAFEKFLPHSSHEILLQQDNARPHVSIKTRKYFKKKHLHPIPWSANSADLNLIENIWSILDDKLLKFNINNTEQLKSAMQMAWLEISNDIVRKLFKSVPKRIRQVINRRGFACRY